MNKTHFKYLVSIILLFIITSCDNNIEGPTAGTDVQMAIVELEEEDGYDYLMMDENLDLYILTDDGKASLATVYDYDTKHTINILFDNDGYPWIYEVEGDYYLLGNFDGTKADVGLIEGDDISMSHYVETDVEWSEYDKIFRAKAPGINRIPASIEVGTSDRVPGIKSAQTRSFDTKEFLNIFASQFRPMIIGVGYGIKAIPAMMQMRIGLKKEGYVGMASVLNDLGNEIYNELKKNGTLSSKEYEAFYCGTKLAFESDGAIGAYGNLKDLLKKRSIWGSLGDSAQGFFDALGDGLIKWIKDKEKQEQIEYIESLFNYKGINIPISGSIIGLDDHYDKYKNRTRMTQSERDRRGLDAISFNDFGATMRFKQYGNHELSKGKLIYEGKEGRLETILLIIDDHATFEYLVSYDIMGFWVDCIRVGEIMVYAGDRGTSLIEFDTVTFVSQYYEEELVSTTHKYRITESLRFEKI